MKSLFALALTAVSFAAASEALASSDAPGSPLRFCRDLEETDVRERFRDCAASERGKPEITATVVAAKRTTQECLDLLSAGSSEKRVKWNRAAGTRCLDAYKSYMQAKSPTKEALKKARLACADVAQGLRGKGESCDSNVECQTGLACVGATGGPPGQCAAPHAKGKACDDSALSGGAFFTLLGASRSVCAAGLRCAASGSQLLCVAASDEAGDPGDACQATAECKRGNVCQSGRCVRKC